MAIIKCKMCGGDIEIAPDKTFGTCEYCGSTMTLPKIDDDQRAAAFNRGNHFRRQGEFDKALAVYERIVAEDDTDAEAHWCCALCRFGIEYVEDPASYEYIPTCHRASFDSILEDVDYLAAIEHSDGITRRQYQKDAAKIAEVQRGILATSQKEDPFDVFICYKETDVDTGERSRDSIDAQEVYYQLAEKGYRVFFARVTLEDKAGTEYEPYIFAALNSAKVMIVLGEKPEHFSAVWVKNEWSRYLSLMKRDRSRLLLPCYKNMDPYDLPEQLAVLQSYDMGKIGFIQDLIRGVDKVLRAGEPKETVKETVVREVLQQSASGANLNAQLKRGQIALEDRDWTAADTFFDKALDIDAECAEAYFGKAMAAAQCVNYDDFANKRNAQAYPEKEELTACERDSVRIQDAINQLTIPGYLSEREITDCFFLYDQREYESYTKGWEERLAQEKTYWEHTDRNLSRALRYAKGETEHRYQALREKVFSALEEKINESAAKDAKKIEEISSQYAKNMEEASLRVGTKYEKAVKRRYADYESYCQMQKQAKTVREYKEVATLFEKDGMKGFEDCDERAKQCRTKADRLATEEAETQKRAEEEQTEKIIKALRAKHGSGPEADAEKQMSNALIRSKELDRLFEYYDDIQSQLTQKTSTTEQMNQRKIQLKGKYDSLGLFGGSEKKQLSAEIKMLDQQLKQMEAERKELQIKLLGFQTKAQVEQAKEQISVQISELNKQLSGKSGRFTYTQAIETMRKSQRALELVYQKDPSALRLSPYGLLMTSQIENTNVFFGHYSQARFTDPAPIEWLVLKADERWALLLSKYALDGRPFNEAMVNTCWETSTLRAWLNGSFLQTAFSEEERTMIATATLNSDTDRTVNTRDRVFLLSASEVNQLMPKTELKQCKATQYAQEQGCNVGKSGFSWWWLRSAGRSPTHTAFVRGTGDINSDGNDVVNLYGAVRPALWLDLYS